VQQGSEALDPKQVLGIVRRRGPLVVLCVVVVAGAAFWFSKQETKKYTASASLVFNNNPLGQQIAGLPASGLSSSDLLAQEANNVALVKGGAMAARTASLLGHGLTEERIADSLSVAEQGESDIVVVSATATTPALAAKIANTYAGEFVKQQQSTTSQYFKSTLALVRKQLAALSPQQRTGPDGLGLQERAQTLSLLSELKEGNVEIAGEALPPVSPSSPKTEKDTALGVLLGMLIGLGLVFVLERLDRRIKRPEDLEAIYRLPLLGAIPTSAALSWPAHGKDGKRTVLPPADAEAFRLVRAHLRFFNIDRDLRTVLIASAAPGEGKTTVARHLAEAASQLGSRVLLLEVDLRHPTLAEQLDIQPGPGLTDVLTGAIRMDEATQPVELEAPAEERAGRSLELLAAGSVMPPNPAELLDSQAMAAVLEQAKSSYDLVVIDTPPLTAVSDAFPLLAKVDGIVIVGWVGHSRRDDAERLHRVLASCGSPLLGIIANGTKSGGRDAYTYAKDDKSSPVVASANGASSEKLIPAAKV
jgi:capsular exopolysaccharide synthesis family protein